MTESFLNPKAPPIVGPDLTGEVLLRLAQRSRIELTYDVRSRWGRCAFCNAPHGERCIPSGLQLGSTASGAPPADGVHLIRLQSAPKWAELATGS